MSAVVDPKNARNQAYSEILQDIAKSGKCPFCPGGYTLKTQKILHEIDGWTISFVDPRYQLPNTEYHFLLFPYQHLEDHTEMNGRDWEAMGALATWARKKYKLPAGILITRGGDTAYTGGSVCHIHAQFFIPKKDGEKVQSVTAYFGPYPKK